MNTLISRENNFEYLTKIIALLLHEDFTSTPENISKALEVPIEQTRQDFIALLSISKLSNALYPKDDSVEFEISNTELWHRQILSGFFDHIEFCMDSNALYFNINSASESESSDKKIPFWLRHIEFLQLKTHYPDLFKTSPSKSEVRIKAPNPAYNQTTKAIIEYADTLNAAIEYDESVSFTYMLPREMEIRDYLIGLIKETYKTYGFCSIETPCVEHIENLCSKQGGDNEKLIFKILKRGEKLKIDTAKEENDLVDGGLRYDLTVPLARYYANHSNELPAPFKALQIGNVWRADRPQKGRFRQFMQCDIDILGEPGNLAEIELILATTAILGKLSFQNFTVCINDRNILKAMAAYSGFREDDYDEVFIILDKMDKIGAEGVAKELEEMGYLKENVETYLQLFKDVAPDVTGIRFLKEKLGDCLSEETADSMEMIISSVETAKECEFNIKFDPTLVRGQSYYTGTIFEVTMDDFGGSVAGGGRYDKMIGKFTGQDTPACGFSIGFERIVMLLLENGYEVPTVKEKKAYLLEKKMTKEGLLKVMSLAKADRQAGKQVLIVNMKKNKKFQKEQLTEDGYTEIVDCYADSVENL